MRCIHSSSEMRNEYTMIAIATIRLKLTSTAAILTVARRAVPRSWATAIWRQAGPSVRQASEHGGRDTRREEDRAEQQARDRNVAGQRNALERRQGERENAGCEQGECDPAVRRAASGASSPALSAAAAGTDAASRAGRRRDHGRADAEQEEHEVSPR